MQYQTDSTINNNVGNTNYDGGGGGGNNYYYGGSSGGYSGGEVAGAAALGAVGGMAVGSMMTASAAQPSTTIVENNPYGYTPPPYGYAPPPAYGPPPVGTTVYVLPPGAYSATVNGQSYMYGNGAYYKTYYNGSQVVYVVTNPYG